MTRHEFFKMALTIFMLLTLNIASSSAKKMSIDSTICKFMSCRIIRSEKSIQVIKRNGLNTTKDYEKLTLAASREKMTEIRAKTARQYKRNGYEKKIRGIIAEYNLKTAYFIMYIAHTGEIEAMSIGFPKENENDREKFPDSMVEDIYNKITTIIRFNSWDETPLYTSFATGIPEK